MTHDKRPAIWGQHTTPAEAREIALTKLGPPGPRINPLVTGRREDLEREALALATEVAAAD